MGTYLARSISFVILSAYIRANHFQLAAFFCLAVVRFRFEEPMYSVAENGSSAQLVIVKEGRIEQAINLNFATSDRTAISTSKL